MASRRSAPLRAFRIADMRHPIFDGSGAMLHGARGTAPANLDVLADVIAMLGDTAASLNGTLRALEVNPLWVNGDQVEALDVLVVTEPESPAGNA